MSKIKKIILPTKSTPEVILDPKGIIKITGRLIPENAIEFFNPIDEWINEYFCNPSDITYFVICFEYINSEGIKHLIDFFHKIIHIHLKKNKEKLKIDWYYKDDDEDMLEQGTFLSSVLNIPFNLIKII